MTDDDGISGGEARLPGAGTTPGAEGRPEPATPEGSRKPTPARDGAPPPARTGGGRRGRQERPSRPAGPPRQARGVGEGAPTPARTALTTDSPPAPDGAADLPTRALAADGQEWLVRVTGRGSTGHRPDAGAPLVELMFFRADEPARPVRRAVGVGWDLHELSDAALREALGSSRPVTESSKRRSEGRKRPARGR